MINISIPKEHDAHDDTRIKQKKSFVRDSRTKYQNNVVFTVHNTGAHRKAASNIKA